MKNTLFGMKLFSKQFGRFCIKLELNRIELTAETFETI